MKRSLLIAVVGLIATSAFAGPEILPVNGVRYAAYNMPTGELTPTPGPARYGPPVWSSTYDTGWYLGSYAWDWVVLDWGDIAGPVYIDGFQFAYGTDHVGTFDAIIWFYAEENGWNSAGRVPLAGFRIVDVPGADPETGYNSWVITTDLEGTGYEFTIYGSDLDGDGLVDWGYIYWFDDLPVGSATGPLISGDPDPWGNPPGAENAFDTYAPSDPCDLPGSYTGTWWYSGLPYAQYYMELYGRDIPTECPNPGDYGRFCTGDIDDGGNCLVGLNDLARLLSNYGMTSGATRLDGDVEPYPWGDSDVDLADLAELLSQYGDDCN